MMTLEESLFNLNEDELFGKVETIEVEGSDIIKNMAIIQETAQQIIDYLTDKGIILFEDINYVTEKEMDCIKKLGEILERIEGYEMLEDVDKQKI